MFVNARAIIERALDGVPSVYLQYRAKPGEPRVLELPGGRIEEFESIEAALRREVQEETGMVVTCLDNAGRRSIRAQTSTSEVECLPVYAAYQTILGPIDSIGFYFLCEAEGTGRGSNESERGQWLSLDAIARLLRDDPASISWVDQGGLRYHLDARGIEV